MMHVVKELAAPVLLNCHRGTFERVDEMPVPVMEIDADVLAPIGHPVLRVRIRCRPVQGDLDGVLCVCVCVYIESRG